MRAANNSQYGEMVATGVVVPLNANTPASAVYDSTGMTVATDSAGSSYLVQDPSLLTTPSKSLQDLIVQSTGGANSPYSWNPPSAQTATGTTIDSTGPFSPASNGCITADCAAGLPASRQTSLPAVTFTAGVGGTMVVGYGGSVGAGVYFTPGFGNTTFDAGFYGTYGTGFGFDPSLGGAIGFNKGSAADLRGVASNVNTAAAIGDVGIGGSVTYSNGQATGGSWGIAIKGIPSVVGGTASVTKMTTCTVGFSNIKSGLTQLICQ
jgi:filamentous hemagglutinin